MNGRGQSLKADGRIYGKRGFRQNVGSMSAGKLDSENRAVVAIRDNLELECPDD